MRLVALGIGIAVSAVALPANAQVALDFKECPNDSKLLNGGPTAVFGEGPGTWWGLISDGLQSAFHNDEALKIAYLSKVFGQTFTTLAEARDFNLQSVSTAWDLNHDGYICAFDQRGTRAYRDDPYAQYTYFGISDDRIIKKWT